MKVANVLVTMGYLGAYIDVFAVKCAKNRARYFAERLRDAMQGMGTKDDQLIFILVTRCDVDLENIKAEYFEKYMSSLADSVSVSSVVVLNMLPHALVVFQLCRGLHVIVMATVSN